MKGVEAFGLEPSTGANALADPQLRVADPVGYQTPLQTALLPWRRTGHASSSSCGEPRVPQRRELTSGAESSDRGLAGRLWCVLQQGGTCRTPTYTPLCSLLLNVVGVAEGLPVRAAGCFGTGGWSSHCYRRACRRGLRASRLTVPLPGCLGVRTNSPSHAGKGRGKAERGSG